MPLNFQPSDIGIDPEAVYLAQTAVVTGSRPSASTTGAGATVFDTTLGQPIWSDGTNWVDATGTTI